MRVRYTAGPRVISARHLEARQNGSEGLSKEETRVVVLATVVTVGKILSPVLSSSGAFYLLAIKKKKNPSQIMKCYEIVKKWFQMKNTDMERVNISSINSSKLPEKFQIKP